MGRGAGEFKQSVHKVTAHRQLTESRPKFVVSALCIAFQNSSMLWGVVRARSCPLVAFKSMMSLLLSVTSVLLCFREFVFGQCSFVTRG